MFYQSYLINIYKHRLSKATDSCVRIKAVLPSVSGEPN